MKSSSRIAAACLVLLAGAALFGSGGCGAGLQSRRDEEPTRRQLPPAEELAQEEQRLRDAQHELETLDPAACPDRCRAATSICDASSRICGIAEDLGDADTMARCERASAVCREAAEVTTSCGCERPAPVDAGTV